MAFDEAGNLYVAHYGGGRVAFFDPAASCVGQIPVPGANVTNVAFGGPDRRTLVITDVETGLALPDARSPCRDCGCSGDRVTGYDGYGCRLRRW